MRVIQGEIIKVKHGNASTTTETGRGQTRMVREMAEWPPSQLQKLMAGRYLQGSSLAINQLPRTISHLACAVFSPHNNLIEKTTGFLLLQLHDLCMMSSSQLEFNVVQCLLLLLVITLGNLFIVCWTKGSKGSEEKSF